jgi:hypothetical protein
MRRAHRLSAGLFGLFAGLSLGCEQAPAHPTAPIASATSSDAPSASNAPSAAGSAAQGSGDAGAMGVTKTLFVREMRADCEGEGPMKCLQVRESESDPWTLFYSRIDGFDYEEGYAYELRVEVLPDPRPPADGSSRRYRLVEVVSKHKVDAPKKP